MATIADDQTPTYDQAEQADQPTVATQSTTVTYAHGVAVTPTDDATLAWDDYVWEETDGDYDVTVSADPTSFRIIDHGTGECWSSLVAFIASRAWEVNGSDDAWFRAVFTGEWSAPAATLA